MTIGPHVHPCDKCWDAIECCGEVRQLPVDYHGPNEFACIEYEAVVFTETPYLCDECEAREVIRAK